MEPSYILDDECTERANKLCECGRQYYDDKCCSQLDRFWSSFSDWPRGQSNDALNRRFGDDCARLMQDLLFDSEGSLKFEPELWQDIRHTISPSLVDALGYMPIPRVEYTDNRLDLVLETWH